MSERVPFATRHLPAWFRVAAELTQGDAYLEETKEAFVSRGMVVAKGRANPKRLEKLYDELMADAGLPPL